MKITKHGAQPAERMIASMKRFEPEHAPPDGPSLDDFLAHLPDHSYIFRPTGALYPMASVNAMLPPVPSGKKKPFSPSQWLDRNQPVHQATWAPGLPELIKDRGIREGGWFEQAGLVCYNQYRPPTIRLGCAADAGPWIDLIRYNYPDDAGHMIAYFAQRVQHPETKINHALVMIGAPGIGKDTILEALKHAVGPWNFREIGPHNLLEPFNPFLKSVVLRISEARDLGEVDRFQFYERIKTCAAAPPDVLMCNEKHLRQQHVLNISGVIITSNHETDCIYLPADDRRHYVACSERKKEDFRPEYWAQMWRWYETGGYQHVAAYLAQLDLSAFNPKAPPPLTPAFWNIADASRASEDAELADVLDDMRNPVAVTIHTMASLAPGPLSAWLMDRKNRPRIPHRMKGCGYVPTRNDIAQDGLWKINGRRQVVYARADLSLRDRLDAAQKLT